MPQNPIDDKSTLVRVMAWWRHQTLTWADVDTDLWSNMASLVQKSVDCKFSLGHDEHCEAVPIVHYFIEMTS